MERSSSSHPFHLGGRGRLNVIELCYINISQTKYQDASKGCLCLGIGMSTTCYILFVTQQMLMMFNDDVNATDI